jgi:hypothetical protein
MLDDKKIGAGAGAGGMPDGGASASAAVAALQADPNYCASVRVPGSAVNTTVHNFKAAYNAWVASGDPSAPSSPLPIGTGNYENVVADALASVAGGGGAPPGCDGYVPPAPAPNPPPVGPPPATPTTTGGMPSWLRWLLIALVAGGAVATSVWLYRKYGKKSGASEPKRRPRRRGKRKSKK